MENTCNSPVENGVPITPEHFNHLMMELKKAQKELAMLSETVLGGTARLSVDDEFRIITATDGYYRMTGYTEAESQSPPFCGKGMNLVVPQDRPIVTEALQKLLVTNEPATVTYRIQKKDESIAWNTAYCARVEETGAERTVNVFFIDITDKHQAETKLESLINTIPDSLIRLLIGKKNMVRYVNKEFYRQTGWQPEELPPGSPLSQFYQIIYPDDRQMVKTQFLDYVKSDLDSCIMDYRIRTRQGDVKWMHARAFRFRSDMEAGQIIQFIISDITEEKLQREATALNEERYRIISEQTRDTVFDWDILKDRIQFSPVYEKMFGFPPPPDVSIKNLTEYDIVHPDDKQNVEDMISAILGGAPYAEAEYRAKRADGTYLWCRNRVTTIFDSEKRPVHAIGLLSDIDDYKQETALLQEKATRDSLTSLLNRMALQRQVERRLKKYPGRLNAFLLLDIDHFKEINDTRGHSMGDTVLKSISALLSQHFRSTDVIGRMGGDEFAVFLTDLPSPSATLRKAGELKHKTAQLFESGPLSGTVTVSIGISLYPYGGKDFQTLYQKADEALYQVKRKGGNGYFMNPPHH